MLFLAFLILSSPLALAVQETPERAFELFTEVKQAIKATSPAKPLAHCAIQSPTGCDTRPNPNFNLINPSRSHPIEHSDEEILRWVESKLRTLRLPFSPISIQKDESNTGKNNLGISYVRINQVPSYVLKIASCEDTQKLAHLHEHGILNPTCLRDVNAIHFSKMLASTPLRASSLSSTSNHFCLQLLELAPGKALKQLSEDKTIDAPRKAELYEKFGTQLSELHRQGWIHNDLHADNVFVDISSGNLTLIDNETLVKSTKIEDQMREVSLLLNHLTSKRTLFSKLIQNLHSNPQGPTHELEVLGMLNSHLLLYKSFIQGYLANLDEPRKNYFKRHFNRECFYILENYIYQNTESAYSDEYDASVKKILSENLPNLLDCTK